MADSTANGSRRETFDAGAQRIAAAYAQALLGVGDKSGKTDALLDEFESFIREVLEKLPRLDAVLSSGMIASEAKISLLERGVGSQASPEFLNFLRVVANHGRLDQLRSIYRAARKLLDQARGLVRVRVSTAAPIDEALAARIAATVQQVTGGQPVLDRHVQPDLIGGVVLQVGDTVYDGSVAAQLQRLRTKMIDRSVHEIQRQRDRFSPAG